MLSLLGSHRHYPPPCAHKDTRGPNPPQAGDLCVSLLAPAAQKQQGQAICSTIPHPLPVPSSRCTCPQLSQHNTDGRQRHHSILIM